MHTISLSPSLHILSLSSHTQSEQCMHLTNYAINKHSSDFVRDDDSGSKRRITTVNQWFRDNGYDVDKIWHDIEVKFTCTCSWNLRIKILMPFVHFPYALSLYTGLRHYSCTVFYLQPLTHIFTHTYVCTHSHAPMYTLTHTLCVM